MHQRASQWYEDNGLEVEAFRHAVAAGDVARAAHLVEDRGIPLHYRDAVAPVLNWLASLPKPVLAARPSLWATHASLLLVIGQTAGVEEKLQAAEAALPMGEPDDKTRFQIGQIAAARSVLALTRYQVDAMLAQARRALEYLGPSQVVGRSTALWTLGYALYLLGDYAAAGQAFREGIALSQAAGRIFTLILATIGLGNVLEAENQLPSAAETYRRVLHMGGEHPLQIVHEAHLGLARVLYEWNDLAAAEQHARLSLDLARQYESNIDRFVLCEVFLARLRLAQGDAADAASGLAQAEETVRRLNFVHRRAEVAEAQVLALLRQGNVTAAAALAHGHALPLSQARVLLAQGQAAAALEVLAPRRQHAEAKGWASERLKALALQALAHQALGDQPRAVQALETALALAEPAGCIRSFVDEGAPMAQLLAAAARRGVNPAYTGRLLAAVDGEKQARAGAAPGPGPAPAQPSIEPLTPRELEVLRLIARGLSNLEISEQLFLALDTVKGHNRRIFDKLQVQRRTEAVARARELGVL
jgi:LuxR family maltose regulon positive regulatory protein